jgi:phage recombination protein Bet
MTSTDVSTASAPAALPSLTFTESQVRVIRDQICRPKERDATPEEFALFLSRCERTGLDPLAGQIVAVFRKNKAKGGAEEMAMQVTVEGQRAIANATGEYIGSDREWCAADGQWTDVWLDPKNPPAAARVTVHRLRGDRVIDQKAVVAWHEADGASQYPSPFWKSQPAHMLAKTAEARALKIAFPAELAQAQEAVATPEPAGDGALPGWAQPASDAEWRQAGETFGELVRALNVGREAAEDAWRGMTRSFPGHRPQGFARAVTDGLAVLVQNVPAGLPAGDQGPQGGGAA